MIRPVILTRPEARCSPDKPVRLAVIFSMFMHAGWMHLGGNVWFLWIFGNNVEDHLGPVKYLLFYLAGGIVASVAHVAVQPDSTIPVVGASGAVAAVMGAYGVWFPNAPIRTFVVIILWSIKAKWWLGVLAAEPVLHRCGQCDRVDGPRRWICLRSDRRARGT